MGDPQHLQNSLGNFFLTSIKLLPPSLEILHTYTHTHLYGAAGRVVSPTFLLLMGHTLQHCFQCKLED